MATWSTRFPEKLYADEPDIDEIPLRDLMFGEVTDFDDDEMFDDLEMEEQGNTRNWIGNSAKSATGLKVENFNRL
jgi:hypothetical protein